ncbi:MAG TPA: replication protein [Candidatus Udaeobacter sp.]
MTDFAQLARVSRRALYMYNLTERERRVSEVIIEWSFGRGRETAVIPEHQAFVDLTGLHKSNVSRTLELLIMRRIVQVRGPQDAREYSFLPAASYWQETKPLFDPQRAIGRAAELDRINGQMKLESRDGGIEEADLDDAMASVSREMAVEPGVADLATSAGVAGLATGEGVADLATVSRDARAHPRDVLQDVSTKRIAVHVGCSPQTQRRFADDEKNYVFDQFETAANKQARDRDDFTRNRFTWLRRFGDQDFAIIRRALGIVREREQNPANKREKPLGAVLFRECVRIARAAGKTFHLW